MSGSPRILFVVDAGPQVGGGHVMRSLTLAGALQSLGAACTFTSPPAVEAILQAFAPAAPRAPADATTPAALFVAAQACAFDAIVFDHYGLSEPDHRAMARGRPVLVIDDLADRALGADLILDSGPARKAEDYDGLIPPAARLLLGPAHAPVRPEFSALREEALARRDGPVERVLISLGLTDVGGVTAKVVERMRLRFSELRLDIVLGSSAPSLPGLARLARRDPRLNLYIDAQDMALLTAEADIAVGAAGSTTWERCTLGLPSALVILADNQRGAAQALGQRGAALIVDRAASDFDAALDRAVTRLIVDPALRASLAAESARVCDGQGAGRVAKAFLQLIRDTTPQPDSDAIN